MRSLVNKARRVQGILTGQKARIEGLAEVRGETPAVTARRLRELGVRLIPRVPAHAMACRDLPVEVAELRDGRPYVQIAGGRSFIGHPGPAEDDRLFAVIQDLLPPALSSSTYRLAHDIQRRYVDVRHRALPGSGGVIVEAGAYVGIKAVRFADAVAPGGRVIAIEMMPDNVEVMHRNIELNGLTDIITVERCGLWSEPGELTAGGTGRQRNSLVSLDEMDARQSRTVPTDSLDRILDRHDVEHVDYMNVQINGAELEALKGLHTRLDSVKIMRIAAYYNRDGQSNSDACCEVLEARGCVVLSRSPAGGILACPRSRLAENERFRKPSGDWRASR